MSEAQFKVGDKVKTLYHNGYTDISAGTVGEVTTVYPGNHVDIKIEGRDTIFYYLAREVEKVEKVNAFEVGDEIFVMAEPTTAGGGWVDKYVALKIGKVISKDALCVNGEVRVEVDGIKQTICEDFLINLTNIDKDQVYVSRRSGAKYHIERRGYAMSNVVVCTQIETGLDGMRVFLQDLARVEPKKEPETIDLTDLDSEAIEKVKEFADSLRKQAPPTDENKYIWLIAGEGLENDTVAEVLGTRDVDGDYRYLVQGNEWQAYITTENITKWRPAEVK